MSSEIEDYALEAAAKALTQIKFSGMSPEAKKEFAQKVLLKYGLAPRGEKPSIVGGFKTFKDHVQFVEGLKRAREKENLLIDRLVKRAIDQQLPAFLKKILGNFQTRLLESYDAMFTRIAERNFGSRYRKPFNNGDKT